MPDPVDRKRRVAPAALALVAALAIGCVIGAGVALAMNSVFCPTGPAGECEGGPNRDELFGTSQHDVMKARQSDDIMHARAGTDELNGNDDKDFGEGGDDDDYIDGQEGADSWDCGGVACGLDGVKGWDEISGGDRGDTLLGGDGHDDLFGGPAVDALITWDDGEGGDTISPGVPSGLDRDHCFMNRNDTLLAECVVHFP